MIRGLKTKFGAPSFSIAHLEHSSLERRLSKTDTASPNSQSAHPSRLAHQSFPRCPNHCLPPPYRRDLGTSLKPPDIPAELHGHPGRGPIATADGAPGARFQNVWKILYGFGFQFLVSSLSQRVAKVSSLRAGASQEALERGRASGYP